MSVDDRVKTVNKIHLCENCLRLNHDIKSCPNRDVCRYCKLKHHSLLHVTPSSFHNPHTTNEPTLSTSLNNTQPSTSTVLHTQPNVLSSSISNYIMLATAEIFVISHSGIVVTARALLDSGSQLNFITKSLADKLGVRSTPSSVAIQGIGCSLLNSSGSALITSKSKHNGYTTKFEAQILSKISNNQPAFNFDLSQFSTPNNLQLADPKFHSCQRVDMLIGAESFYELQCVGQFKLGPGLPYLQKTQFGWGVSGSVDIFNKDQGFCHLVELNSSCYLNRLLEQFWEVEEKEDDTDISTNSCEQHFISTHQRQEQGRFVVRLPFKNSTPDLG